MAGRIVLFGATGYTGELTARALVEPWRAARARGPQRGEGPRAGRRARRPGLGDRRRRAARHRARARRARRRAGHHRRAVRALGRARPSRRRSARARTTSTRRARRSFIRDGLRALRPARRPPAARCSRPSATTGCPATSPARSRCARPARPRTSVEIGYFNPGAARRSMSGGTRASAAGVLLSRRLRLARRAHRRRAPGAPGARSRSPGSGRARSASAASEHFALPRIHTACATSASTSAGSARRRAPLQAFSAELRSCCKVPGRARRARTDALRALREGLDRRPRRRGARDSPLARPRRSLDASGHASGRGAPRGRQRLRPRPRASSPGAPQTAARRGLQGTGALGPVDGFGLDALEAGCAEAGLARVRRSPAAFRVTRLVAASAARPAAPTGRNGGAPVAIPPSSLRRPSARASHSPSRLHALTLDVDRRSGRAQARAPTRRVEFACRLSTDPNRLTCGRVARAARARGGVAPAATAAHERFPRLPVRAVP